MGRKKESKLPSDLIKILIQTYDIKGIDDIKAVIRDPIGDTLQGMLESELRGMFLATSFCSIPELNFCSIQIPVLTIHSRVFYPVALTVKY